MAVDSPTPEPKACDGIDHGLPANRVGALVDEALAFNRVLKASEDDRPGKGDAARVEEAGGALYHELINLPVGERQALLKYVEAYNKMDAGNDPAMPTVSADIDSNAFLESLTVKFPYPFYSDQASQEKAIKSGEKGKDFVSEEFVFQGWGMCAKFSQLPPEYPAPPLHPWIELPAF